MPGKRRRSSGQKTIGIDGDVYEALGSYCYDNGGEIKAVASIAISRFLKTKGIEVEYPPKKPRSTAA